jgi:hypothetical protein
MDDNTRKIPEFRLIREPASEEAAAVPPFKWAAPEIGKRHKLGGEPHFIQKDTWPPCPSCQKKMTFYGQLDSISDDICIADCGMVFIFICFDCYESESIVQSY